MTEAQFQDGLAYAEDNFKNENAPHLKVDKRLIREQLNLDGARILDFGCGMGGMSLWYATNFDCSVYALDIDRHHVRIANTLKDKYAVENVEFSQRNVLEVPLAAHERFDYIFLNDVAEHIQYPILQEIMVQLKRGLAPGGKIFVSYPPWQGPYASHVSHVTGLPWCQFLPERILIPMIEKNNRVIVGDLESDLLEAYRGLNHLTHARLLRVVRAAGLRPTYRKSHSLVNRMGGPLKHVNLRVWPFDLLVTKEFVMLERTDTENDASPTDQRQPQKRRDLVTADKS